MELWEAIVLGIIQGLTEFLPVSSSGHLELGNYLFGIEGESSLQFSIALHGGTVLSTLVVFWKEIGKIFRGVFKFTINNESIYAINILVSMLPILVVGLFFKDFIEQFYNGNIVLVGAMLILTALLLTFAHKVKPRQNPITPKSAFIIGIAQAIAVVPGLSRSGSTIATGLLLGVKREEVAKFSFLMVLVPIIGMNVLELIGGNFGVGGTTIVNLACGFLASFIVGYFACCWMIKLVSKGKLIWFAIYCMLVGIAAIFFGLL